MRAVLISGIPATGKTCFGEWLASYRGFQHLDLEKGYPARLNPFAMESLAFIEAARAGRPNLVVTWGFPPNPTCLAKVRELHAAGLVPWWFDGDRDAAFECFQRRPDHPGSVSDWARQLMLIQAAWPEIVGLYDDRRIDVIGAGPTYLDREEIFARMFP